MTRQQHIKRPLPLTIIAWLFILVGVGSLLRALFFALLADSSHINYPLGRFHADDVLALAIGLAALAGGVLVLRRSEWGRWLILAWLVFHFVISVDHPLPTLVTHFLLLVVVGYFLMRPQASAYFRGR